MILEKKVVHVKIFLKVHFASPKSAESTFVFPPPSACIFENIHVCDDLGDASTDEDSEQLHMIYKIEGLPVVQ